MNRPHPTNVRSARDETAPSRLVFGNRDTPALPLFRQSTRLRSVRNPAQFGQTRRPQPRTVSDTSDSKLPARRERRLRRHESGKIVGTN